MQPEGHEKRLTNRARMGKPALIHSVRRQGPPRNGKWYNLTSVIAASVENAYFSLYSRILQIPGVG